jgi:DNA-binding FrmR family transcriptional regulator
MQPAIEQFRLNIKRIRSISGLYKALRAMTTEAIDTSDILRTQIVMVVSAFDYFIHEIVRLGMIETHRGNRSKTGAFLKYRVSLESIQHIGNTLGTDEWLDSEIRSQHGWKSFQHSDKVADAIRLISDKSLWEEVGREIGKPARDTKQELDLIVDRRNKIAHEADVDPTYNTYWPIDEILVDDVVNFMESIAEAIYKIL